MIIILLDPWARGDYAVVAVDAANDDEIQQCLTDMIGSNFEDPGAPQALNVIKTWTQPLVSLPEQKAFFEAVNAAICKDEGSDLAVQFRFYI